MSHSNWRDSEQELDKPRPAIQGRTELEDSLLAARREDQAQERRRAAALSQALKARSIDSDPQGKKFLADRARAMAARRAENAKLKRESEPAAFSVSLLEVWEDAAHTPNDSLRRRNSWRRIALWLLGVVAAACMAVAVWWMWSATPGV